MLGPYQSNHLTKSAKGRTRFSDAYVHIVGSAIEIYNPSPPHSLVMELYFRSTQDDIRLSSTEAFARDPQAAHNALTRAIRDATSTHSRRQSFKIGLQDLLSEVSILYIVEQCFIGAINNASVWKPRRTQLDVLKGCSMGQYSGWIEGLFYDVGGLRVAAALLFAVKLNRETCGHILALPAAARKRLAELLKQTPLPNHFEDCVQRLEPQCMCSLAIRLPLLTCTLCSTASCHLARRFTSTRTWHTATNSRNPSSSFHRLLRRVFSETPKTTCNTKRFHGRGAFLSCLGRIFTAHECDV